MKKIFIVSICLISILGIGCIKSEKTTENQDSKQVSIQDSLTQVKSKLVDASYYNEDDKASRSMEQSIEYIKTILPQGIKEVSKEYKKDKGITEIIYEVDDFKFTVWFIHPLGKGESIDDEYDIKNTSGIYFSDINWHNTK